jgi:hypothetical protein
VFGMGTGVTLLLWPPETFGDCRLQIFDCRSKSAIFYLTSRIATWGLGSLPSASYAAFKEGRPRASCFRISCNRLFFDHITALPVGLAA